MLITPANLQLAFQKLDMKYQAAFAKAPIYWDKFASMIPSETTFQFHAFLDRSPQMRQWIGERQITSSSVRNIVLENLDFELTQSINVNKFKDDQYGIYSPLMEQMGYSAAMWPDNSLMLPTVQNGDQNSSISKSYDGVPFYSASHPVDASRPNYGAAQINLFTGNPLTQSNYTSTRATMMSYLGADGTPWGVMPNILLVPPALEQIAKQIVSMPTITQVIQAGALVAAGGSTAANTAAAAAASATQGTAEVVVWPQLQNDPTTWYLLDTTRSIRPFVYQLREAPVFTFLNKPTDQNTCMLNEFIYGINSRGAGGYGLWPFASKNLA